LAVALETHNHGDPITFRERLASLVGGTTYRVPVGGRSTSSDQTPLAHALSAAIASSRKRITDKAGERVPDPDDIGPDMLSAMIWRRDDKKGHIVHQLCAAFCGQRDKICHRNRGFLGLVANSAFESVVHGDGRDKPSRMDDRDWLYLHQMMVSTLVYVAEDACQRAEECYRRRTP
jgi:hypothetical protein